MAQRKIVCFLHLITKKFRRNIECSVQWLVESFKGLFTLRAEVSFWNGFSICEVVRVACQSRIFFFYATDKPQKYQKTTERNPFSQGKGHSEMGTKTDGSLSTSFKRYKYILSLFSHVQIMYY